MTDESTAMARYVFLDVVGFTAGRSVEAQSDIVATLNGIVTMALGKSGLSDDDTILIPTGDGICIAIVSQQVPFDIHVTLAVTIIGGVADHNDETSDKMRNFSVRVGINANVDNIITDINGRRNVAGAGISTAQRIMDLGGANTILIGPTVHDVLATRERYLNAFRSFPTKLKHGQEITVYQLIKDGFRGLSTEVPGLFVPKANKPRKIPLQVAYYIAEAVQNEEQISGIFEGGAEEYSLVVLLWFRAHDRVEERNATKVNPNMSLYTRKRGEPFADQHEFYAKQDFWVYTELSELIKDRHLAPFWEYFENAGFISNYLFVSDEGKARLETEHPGIMRAGASA